jgi:hypothetical protein
LIDPLIERAQAHTSLNRRAPTLSHLAQTLTKATSEQHILIQIHPKPLVLLSDGKFHNHIVLALLALHHWHPQIAQMSPTGRETPAGMAITGEMVGILAATKAASPVNCAWLSTDPAIFPLFSSQFDADLGFQKRFSDGLDGGTGRHFRLLLYCLQDIFALLTLEFPRRKRYTHVTEDSFVLGRCVLMTLLYHLDGLQFFSGVFPTPPFHPSRGIHYRSPGPVDNQTLFLLPLAVKVNPTNVDKHLFCLRAFIDGHLNAL